MRGGDLSAARSSSGAMVLRRSSSSGALLSSPSNDEHVGQSVKFHASSTFGKSSRRFAKTASAGSLVGVVKLPPIKPVPLSFEDIYSLSKNRVAKKNAVSRRGGLGVTLVDELSQSRGPRASGASMFSESEASWAACALRVVPPHGTEDISDGNATSACAEDVISAVTPGEGSSSATVIATPASADEGISDGVVEVARRRTMKGDDGVVELARRRTTMKGPQGDVAAVLSSFPQEEMSREAKNVAVLKKATTFTQLHDENLAEYLAGSLDEIICREEKVNAEQFSDAEIARFKSAYTRFLPPESHEINATDLFAVLNHLGYMRATEEVCDEIVAEVTDYATLDFGEFIEFMDRYSEYEKEEIAEVFLTFDVDNNGTMSTDELGSCLESLGITPLKKTLSEAFAMVGSKESETLTCQEFCRLMTVYRITEGFTFQELRKLNDVFIRCLEEGGGGDVDGIPKKGRVLKSTQIFNALLHMFGPQAIAFAKDLMKKMEQPTASRHGSEAVPSPEDEEEEEEQEKEREEEEDVEAEEEDAKAEVKDVADRREEDGETSPLSGEGSRVLKLASDVEKNTVLTKEWLPGGLTFQEFVSWARRLREAEIDEFRTQFAAFAQDGPVGLVINTGGIRDLLRTMGYRPLQQTIDAMLKHVDEDNSDSIDFDEFLNLTQFFRETDGFTLEEVAELREAFDVADVDKSSQVCAAQTTELLRHIGYSVELPKARELVAAVDFNGNGYLDFREFLRLARINRENELTLIEEIFNEQCVVGTDYVVLSGLVSVICHFGYRVSEANLKEDDGPFRFDEAMVRVDQARRGTIRLQRRHAGFTDLEIEYFREKFDEYDRDGNDQIDRQELGSLFTDLGMPLRTTLDQKKLLDKIEEARIHALTHSIEEHELVTAAKLSVSFWHFIHLIRCVRNEDDSKEVEREERAIGKTRFNGEEVAGFREVFNDWVLKSRFFNNDVSPKKALAANADGQPEGSNKGGDSGDVAESPAVAISSAAPRRRRSLVFPVQGAASGKLEDPWLSFEALRRVLRSFGVAMTPAELVSMEEKMLTMRVDDRGRIDFPDFLLMMRWFMDTNFANINSVAEKVMLQIKRSPEDEASGAIAT
eukprot:TRINITY_DN56737_c0_g1_i1.p1 TRINITY_DN56737_c0_g1~~TRINITY_DN56737_c0_g1_i1.p1  ORF type:complete len:1105 (-),score=209.84 TRINITY_DN56737_c0_g1_i1:114-3428(-)